MELKFRSYNKETGIMYNWEYIRKVRNLSKIISLNHVVVMQFTGLKDCEGNDIYDGDTLIDVNVDLEQGVKLEDTKQQVYWCEKYGCWNLDNTFVQDKKDGFMLYKELRDFKYKISGNIYENNETKNTNNHYNS